MSRTHARILFLLVAVLVAAAGVLLLAADRARADHVGVSIWVKGNAPQTCMGALQGQFGDCKLGGGGFTPGDKVTIKEWDSAAKNMLIAEASGTADGGGGINIGGGGSESGRFIEILINDVLHITHNLTEHSVRIDAVNDVVSGSIAAGSVNLGLIQRAAVVSGDPTQVCGREIFMLDWETDFSQVYAGGGPPGCVETWDIRPGDYIQIANNGVNPNGDIQLSIWVPEFNDVVVTSTHAENISQMALENITLGCDANWNYCPNDPVTRAQMGSFLGRFLDVLGNGGVLGAVSGFDDVPDGNVHAARIRQIADAGITLGCNPAGTLYCPDDPVTRAQMATFIARALGLAPEPDNRFSDVVTGSTHAGNINAVAEAGVTLGCDPGGTMFCPNDSVTRAQMASFLIRALNIP